MRNPRLLLRDLATALALGLPLLALVVIAWASRNPDHPSVVAVRGWPLVGSWFASAAATKTEVSDRTAVGDSGRSTLADPAPDEVRRSFSDLRVWFAPGTEIFTDPTAPLPHTTLDLPTRLAVAYQSGAWVAVAGRHRGWTRLDTDPTDLAELPSQHRQVWVRPGERLRASEAGNVVEEVDVITNLPVTDTGGGDWVEVVHRDRKLWLRAPEFTGGPPPLGSAVSPIRPLAAVSITPARLRSAQGLFRGDEIVAESGPYRVMGDSPRVRSVAAVCYPRLAAIDGEMERATGVAPLPEARETLLLFADRAVYRRFVSDGPVASSDPDGYALAAQGFAATYLNGVSDQQVCSVLVHEAVHLASRRSFGPALPPWLSEGLASWIDGRPQAAVDASLCRRLVRLDDEFYADDLDFRYRQSAALVRVLLTDGRIRDATRKYLEDRAGGKPLSMGPGLAVESFWLGLVDEIGISEDELWRRVGAAEMHN